MERLLTRAETDTHIIYTIGHGRFRVDKRETSALRRVFDRLAVYEDTGLTPEEIMGLCKMDRRAKIADLLRLEEYQSLSPVEELAALVKSRDEGRVVVLPCKVGDWLYYLRDDNVKKAKVEEIQCSANKHNPQFDVTVFAWDFSAKEQLTYCPAGDSWTDNSGGFVRVFTTRAEAETAIGGGGDG